MNAVPARGLDEILNQLATVCRRARADTGSVPCGTKPLYTGEVLASSNQLLNLYLQWLLLERSLERLGTYESRIELLMLHDPPGQTRNDPERVNEQGDEAQQPPFEPVAE